MSLPPITGGTPSPRSLPTDRPWGASSERRTAPGWIRAVEDPTAATVDPRLPLYLVVAFGLLVAAVALGRYEVVAAAVPFAGLAAVGLHNRQHPRPVARIRLATERVLEGDVIEGTVELDWEGDAELDVILASARGVTPIDPAPVVGWSLPAGPGPVTLPFRLQARVWGRHELGKLSVRARRPGGLHEWEQEVATAPAVRVLPAPLRLNQLLQPAEPRAVAGAHLSRLRGAGSDFAELRPYSPGDRLRDVSWSATARAGEPWVTTHHPERTGTVLLLLDAFFSNDEASSESLARAARTAWAVASLHLRAQDRVGLLAVGRTTAWLPPRGGKRARWLLLDELLAVGAAAEDWRQRRWRVRPDVPPDALVVGITSLRAPGFPRDLVHHRRSGRTTVAVVIDTSDLLPAPATTVDAAAQRLWRAELDLRRHELERSGVPTATVHGASGVAPAVSLLRRATSRSGKGRASA